MANKIKQTQKEDLRKPQGRDLFQTPNYATDILVPFLKSLDIYNVWECACGNGKIVNRLEHHGISCVGTDLQGNPSFNFLNDYPYFNFTQIVTNPPYSLKKRFYLKCLSYSVPFALLIPADYSGWVIDAIQNGAEKIIPTRRIDFITPTGKSGATGQTSNYHSLWLTHGFNFGKTETFVELTNEMKRNI